MRPLILLICLVGLLAADQAFAQPVPEDSVLALPTEWETLYVSILQPGADFRSQRAPGELEGIMNGHMQYQLRLQANGQAMMAGGFAPDSASTDIGITLLRAASLEEARELAEADPAVKAGYFKVLVRTWWVPATGSTPR